MSKGLRKAGLVSVVAAGAVAFSLYYNVPPEEQSSQRREDTALSKAVAQPQPLQTRDTTPSTEKRKEILKARIEAMLRKSQSENERKRFTPPPDASLQELEKLSTTLEEAVVKAMQE